VSRPLSSLCWTTQGPVILQIGADTQAAINVDTDNILLYNVYSGNINFTITNENSTVDSNAGGWFMKKTAKSYHHGNLRDALVESSLQLLDQASPADLSLRQVARQAGVSHNAVYRHFADKDELLAAIAAEGFQLLNAQLQRHTSPFLGAPRTKLFTAARSYLEFVREHPNQIRIMFSDLSHSNQPELNFAAQETFAILLDIIAEGQQRGALEPGETRLFALTYWALLQGFAELLISKKFPFTMDAEQSVDEVERKAIELFLNGLGAEPSA
jgi:AcrR family transcriptional regulator